MWLMLLSVSISVRGLGPTVHVSTALGECPLQSPTQMLAENVVQDLCVVMCTVKALGLQVLLSTSISQIGTDYNKSNGNKLKVKAAARGSGEL